MECVHPDGVPGGLDGRRSPCRLEHAELRLQLRRMAAERIEGFADPFRVEGLPRRMVVTGFHGDVLQMHHLAGSLASRVQVLDHFKHSDAARKRAG